MYWHIIDDSDLTVDNSLYGNFRTRTFCEIFPDLDTFKTEWENSGLTDSELKPESLKKLYYLLYSAYGNSHIASSDENQFKYKLWAIILNKGVIWQKNLEVQTRLRNLTESEIMQAERYISNNAYNPGEQIKVGDDNILDYINNQNTTKRTGSYLASFAAYMETLVDVSSAFIKDFKKLFLKIVNPELPLWYISKEEK